MGYKSPFIRFGDTRYEKNIVKLRRYDLKRREEAYKDAVETFNDLDTEPHVSWTLLWNVFDYVAACERALKRGSVDDDAMLVFQYGKRALGREEYDWMKRELAKKGEDVEDPWSSK